MEFCPHCEWYMYSYGSGIMICSKPQCGYRAHKSASAVLTEPEDAAQDAAQEAACRIAENKHNAEVSAREKAIRAHMQRLEYYALPKCAHGLPNDAGTWRDHYERYHPLSAHPHRIRQFSLSHVPRCGKCEYERRVRTQREEADRAEAIAVEARRIVAVRIATAEAQMAALRLEVQRLRAEAV